MKQKEINEKFKELEQQRIRDKEKIESEMKMKELIEQTKKENERQIEMLKWKADLEKQEMQRKIDEDKFRAEMATQLKDAENAQKMEILKNQMSTQLTLAQSDAQNAKDQAAAAATAAAAAAAKPAVIYPGWGPGSNWFCHSCGQYRGNRYCPSHGSSNGYWS